MRSVLVIGSAFAGVVGATLLIALTMVGPNLPTSEKSDAPVATTAIRPGEPDPTAGALGGLRITGDRSLSLAVDREVDEDRFTLAGPNGRIGFDGQPATISRLRVDGLEFYLDPEDCEYQPGERDPDTGLAPLEVTCSEISDIRDTATVTAQGTLFLPADQLGLRGDLPPSGGDVTAGDLTLTFSAASVDLRRPDVIETRPGFITRFPTIYPAPMVGDNGSLEFEYDWELRELRLLEVIVNGATGDVESEACALSYTEIGAVSPRVTTVEMTFECGDGSVEGLGGGPLTGTLIVDVTALPSGGLQ